MIFNPSLPEIDEANFPKRGLNNSCDDMKLIHVPNSDNSKTIIFNHDRYYIYSYYQIKYFAEKLNN